MSAQSNPFQKLILRIHEQLDPAGIRISVQESAFAEEPTSGSPREVDVQVIIETPDGMQRIAIECRDYSNRSSPVKQDITWIDQLIGKYVDLDFDKVIAVSSTGFYAPALAKAAKHNVECRTLEDALAVDWPAEFIRVGIATGTHDLADLRFGIKCDPPLPGRNESDDRVIDSNGKEGTYADLCRLLQVEGFRSFLEERRKKFRVLADLDAQHRIEIERQPKDLFILHNGKRYAVVRLTFACTVVSTKTKHPVRHRRYPGAMVSTAEGVLDGETLTVIQTQEGGSQAFKGPELEKIGMKPFDSADADSE